MNILMKLKFWWSTARHIDPTASIKIFNDGRPTKEYVIRFKDIYISVLEGETYGVFWSSDPSMFAVPTREFWEANPPKEAKL